MYLATLNKRNEFNQLYLRLDTNNFCYIIEPIETALYS